MTTKNLELDEEIAMYHMLLVEGEAIARCVCVWLLVWCTCNGLANYICPVMWNRLAENTGILWALIKIILITYMTTDLFLSYPQREAEPGKWT